MSYTHTYNMDPEVAEAFLSGNRVWRGVNISEGVFVCAVHVLRNIREELGPQRYPEDLDCAWLIIEVQRTTENSI